MEISLEILGDQEDGESLDDTVAYEEGSTQNHQLFVEVAGTESELKLSHSTRRGRQRGKMFNLTGKYVYIVQIH